MRSILIIALFSFVVSCAETTKISSSRHEEGDVYVNNYENNRPEIDFNKCKWQEFEKDLEEFYKKSDEVHAEKLKYDNPNAAGVIGDFFIWNYYEIGHILVISALSYNQNDLSLCPKGTTLADLKYFSEKMEDEHEKWRKTAEEKISERKSKHAYRNLAEKSSENSLSGNIDAFSNLVTAAAGAANTLASIKNGGSSSSNSNLSSNQQVVYVHKEVRKICGTPPYFTGGDNSVYERYRSALKNWESCAEPAMVSIDRQYCRGSAGFKCSYETIPPPANAKFQ